MTKSEELTTKIMGCIDVSMSTPQYKSTSKKILALLEENGIDNLK